MQRRSVALDSGCGISPRDNQDKGTAQGRNLLIGGVVEWIHNVRQSGREVGRVGVGSVGQLFLPGEGTLDIQAMRVPFGDLGLQRVVPVIAQRRSEEWR